MIWIGYIELAVLYCNGGLYSTHIFTDITIHCMLIAFLTTSTIHYVSIVGHLLITHSFFITIIGIITTLFHHLAVNYSFITIITLLIIIVILHLPAVFGPVLVVLIFVIALHCACVIAQDAPIAAVPSTLIAITHLLFILFTTPIDMYTSHFLSPI